MRTRYLALCGVLVLGASPANASILFANFDALPRALDWNGGTDFSVVLGSVDLVKNHDFGIECVGNTGGCVDLIGTNTPPASSGTLVSIPILLAPGQYELSFDYSGNQRNAAASAFTAAIAGLSFDSGLLGSDAPFQTHSELFTIDTLGSYQLTFAQAAGPGNEGNIIDNLRLNSVPGPHSWTMMIAGFGLIGGALRRSRRISAAAA